MINSTPLNGILKKTDRQYSYENTVLGRYRLEASDGTEECRQRVGFYEEDRIGQLNVGTLRRKSVRFRDSEGAQREVEGHGEQQQRKEGAAWRAPRPKEWMARTRKWAKSLRTAFSCKSIRLMLIDWLFLAILGIGMAMTSMFMDNIIEYLQTFQLVLMSVSGETGNSFLDYICTYLSWLCYTELLVISSAIFVHYVAPQAVGSGIPEMKTILRGVILKDYLTARTLFSKIVGLTFSLGSGIPIGKMGPFVHVAANAANLLSSLAARFDGAYSNECRKSEMLAAACATGVACTFSAPIGGVLFSIEVTTMYFSVRNYWRGFFAAACGATVFRWLRVVAFGTEVTLVAFYQTHFPEDAFEPEELPFFALIGLFCGFIGAGFIFFYRKVVMFLRQNSFAKRNIQNNWLLYPVVVAFLVATFTYPRGYGRFLSGRYKFTRTVLDFFSNCTWSKGLHHSILAPHGCSSELLGTWTNHEGYGPYNVFLVLTLFIVTFLILSALCNTMPIPCGMFMPLFVVGAAFGRLMGEIVSSMFPDGISNGTDQPIFPGIYAVVGAAALTGAVTHSVSVAMICCEITGQLIYIIPLMIAVIIANAICAYLQPSIYDVMIGIKNLPYLPDIPPSNAEVHQCTAENIMVSKVRYLCRLTPFKELRSLLVEMPKLRSFPVVDDSASMMLLGSISRRTIIELLKTQIGDEARKREAEKRIKKAIETIDRHFREVQLDMLQGSVRSVRGEAKSDLEPKDAKGQEMRRRAQSEGGVRAMPAEGTKTIGRRCSASDTNIDKAGDSEGKGEDLDACRTVGKKCSSSMHRVFPAARNGGEGQSSRFVVEPVFSLPKRRCVSNAVGPMAGATRNRRNAISSSSAMEMKEEGTEPRGATSDEGGKETGEQLITQKKTSCPEMIRSNWGTLEHQTPISRNLAEYVRSAKKRLRMVNLRHRENGESVDYDLTDDERREWELAQLGHPLEIEEKLIDPAPFQLVRRTSVYKVHYLFSLLDLERAYVTERGRLVGVVALRDLRIAIQNAQNGHSIRFNLYEFDSTSTGSDKSLDESLSMDVEKGTALINVADTETGQRQQGQAVPPADGMRIDDSASIITVADYPISSPLQRIRKDENEKRNWGRSQSIRSRYLSLGDHPEEVGDDGSGNVARAVAYLRRKSVALERTPLPTVEGETTS